MANSPQLENKMDDGYGSMSRDVVNSLQLKNLLDKGEINNFNSKGANPTLFRADLVDAFVPISLHFSQFFLISYFN